MPVRIYEIAKKLGVESKEVLAKAKELGIAAAKVPSSSLDKITAEYLEQELGEDSSRPSRANPPPAPPPPTPGRHLAARAAEFPRRLRRRTACHRPAPAEPPAASRSLRRNPLRLRSRHQRPSLSPARLRAAHPSSRLPRSRRLLRHRPPATATAGPAVGDKVGFIQLPQTAPADRGQDRTPASCRPRPGPIADRLARRRPIARRRRQARQRGPARPGDRGRDDRSRPPKPARRPRRRFICPPTGEDDHAQAADHRPRTGGEARTEAVSS